MRTIFAALLFASLPAAAPVPRGLGPEPKFERFDIGWGVMYSPADRIDWTTVVGKSP